MTEEQKPTGDVVDQLRMLGQQLGAAVKALWESEETRSMRDEIQQGFVELGQHVDSAIKSAQESAAAKQFGTQIKETVDKARESDVAEKIEEGVVTGLRELNKQLGQFVASWTGTKTTEPPAAPPAPDAESKA
jgi:hypothetical protein